MAANLKDFDTLHSSSKNTSLHQEQFKASTLVYHAAKYLKRNLEAKKRRRLLFRSDPDAYSASEIIDIIFVYLQEEQENFEKKLNVTRKVTAKFCDSFLLLQILAPVHTTKLSRSNCDLNLPNVVFEDSHSQWFRFIDDLARENPMNHLVDETRLQRQLDKLKEKADDNKSKKVKFSSKESSSRFGQVIMNPNVDTPPRRGGVKHTEEPEDSTTSKKSGRSTLKNMLSNSVMFRGTTNFLEAAGKILKFFRKERGLLVPCSVEIDVLREEALAHLLTIVDLCMLDSILNPKSSDDEDSETKNKKSKKTETVSDDADNQNLEDLTDLVDTLDNIENATDPWSRAALNLTQFIPAEEKVHIADILKAKKEVVDDCKRLRMYTHVARQYEHRSKPLWSSKFAELHLALFILLEEPKKDKQKKDERSEEQKRKDKQDRELSALKAFQLSLLLMPLDERKELLSLLMFMKCTINDATTKYNFDEDNKALIERSFKGAIFVHGSLEWAQYLMILRFMLKHVKALAQIPVEVMDSVHRRLDIVHVPEEEKVPEMPKVPEKKGAAFCSRVSVDMYAKQTKDTTEIALRQLVDSIIDDPTLSGKQKQKRLSFFREKHPALFERYFSDLL